MKLPDIDYGKAQTMLHYLASATRRQTVRDHAKQRLDAQISKLRKLTGANVQKKLDELEKQIAGTLRREKRLEEQQQTHDAYHTTLRHKAEALDKKLSVCLEKRAAHAQRIKELESKVRTGAITRAQKIAFLKLDIKMAEHLCRELETTGADATRARKKLDTLTARLARLEKKR